MSPGSSNSPKARPGGDEDAAVFGDHADQIGDPVAVHVGELDTGIPEAHPGGWRRDGLGRLVTGGVAAAQPDQPSASSWRRISSVQVHVGERDLGIGEIEAEIEGD